MLIHPAIRLIAVISAFLTISGSVAADPIEIVATPVAQAPQRISNTLEFRGGLRLTSDNEDFGGFSGLLITGTQLTAVTDKGRLLKARLTLSANGVPTGLRDADLSRLINTRGLALKKKKDADAESLARGADGEILIAFERNHRIQSYPTDYPLPDIIPTPVQLLQGPKNGGAEALARLNDGRMVVIAEGPKSGAVHTKGWVFQMDRWLPFRYRLNDGFRPTGAAPLADGSLIVLERFYLAGVGLAARLRLIDPLDLASGATVNGTLLCELRGPDVPMSNFEGITATQGPNGETLIYLIADNNFNADLDTLLLMFAYTQ